MREPNFLERQAIRATAGVLSRSGSGASLLVVIYHRVPAAPDPLMPDEPCAAKFHQEVSLLLSCFNVLPLREAVGRLRDGTLPARSACITFDEGDANNFEIAAPILRQLGAPATFFVAAGFLDGGLMFNDTLTEFVRRAPNSLDLRPVGLGLIQLPDAFARRAAIHALLAHFKYLRPADRLAQIDELVGTMSRDLPRDLMMSSDQVRNLHALGFEIGAHTIDHPILASLDDTEAASQILRSKETLESILGAAVCSFAYPNGNPARDYSKRHVEMARTAGFELAVSTAYGAATAKSDPFQVPRVSPVGCSPLKLGLRMARVFGARTPQVAD